MYLTDLAAAARKSGLRVVEVSGWQERGRGHMSTVSSVICHHTATSDAARGDIPTLSVLKNGHGSLPGPLSQLGLSRSGVVYVVAAGRCNHAGRTRYSHQSNSNSIGIECEASGRYPIQGVQLEAYHKLVKALITHYGLPVSRVYSHAEVAVPSGRKNDVKNNMNTFRGAVAESRAGAVAAPIVPGGVAALKSNFTEDGILDAGTVKALQLIWGASQDGQVGPETFMAMQRWLGVSPDGQVGPKTLAALATKVGAKGVTEWNYGWTSKSDPMTLAIERYYNRERARLAGAGGVVVKPQAPSVPARKPGKYLTVNGQLNEGTVKVLQRFLNHYKREQHPALVVDGDLGPATVRQLQWQIATPADGDFGPASARALEVWLGLPAEKVEGWYPGLVRGLQRRLNVAIADGVI